MRRGRSLTTRACKWIILTLFLPKERGISMDAPRFRPRAGAGTASRIRRSIGLAACAGLATAAVALASVSTGSYSGTTSEGTAVTLKVVSHGAAITSFKTSIGYNGKCGQGGGPGLTASIARISVGHDGKFSQKTTLTLKSAHIRDPGVVSGKALGRTVTGKVVQLIKGKPNKCYTETFTARKKS